MSNRKILYLALSLTLPLIALAALWLILGSFPTHAQGATTHYVAPGDDCGGASPCYDTIQAAVDAASGEDTIKVAQGVYTSTSFLVVYINKAITVTGGYTTTDWANSYPLTQPTVIDAEDVAGRRGVYIDGTGVATISLERLTIQRGYAQNSNAGGVYILTGTVVLQESQVLSNNSTSTGPDGMGRGGGVYIANGNITLRDNTFQDNSAIRRGAGIYILNGIVTLRDNTFQSNSAKVSWGGGVYVEEGTITVSHNTFGGNSADVGSGVYVDNGTIRLSNNTFQNNSASSYGGGVYVSVGTVILDNNTFQSNFASSRGGGVHVAGGSVTISSNTLQGNSTSFYGGGVYVSGGNVTLNSNDVFSNTSERYGGGVDVYNGTVVLSRNTITHNTADIYGNGIAIHGGTVNARNDFIALNTSPAVGVYLSGGILTARHWTLADNGNYALTTDGGSATLINTIVASHTLAGFSGPNIAADHTLFFDVDTFCGSGASCTNNITGDPKFINPAAGDYHIGPDSAAIDAGVDAGVTTDIDGDPRPQGAGYDVGADEYPAGVPTSTPTPTPTSTPTSTPIATPTNTPTSMPSNTPTPTSTSTSIPTPCGVTVNDGALSSDSTEVTLTLMAPAGTTEMMISNDGGFAGAQWEPYATHKEWQITQYGAYVIPRTVYAKYKDAEGVISSVYQDDIVLDVSEPTRPVGGIIVRIAKLELLRVNLSDLPVAVVAALSGDWRLAISAMIVLVSLGASIWKTWRNRHH